MSVAPDTERTSARGTTTGLDPATTPDTDRGLARTGDKQNTMGWRLLLVGGILFGLGMLSMALGEHVMNFIGVALAGLAAPPTLGGIGLVLSGFVAKRSAQHKPFA